MRELGINTFLGRLEVLNSRIQNTYRENDPDEWGRLVCIRDKVDDILSNVAENLLKEFRA